MKFKKVEIQAFRAYKNVSDGTFNFMTKSDEVADFISIYAPNGFGKTSFYDAVEWGFTHNISRFLRRDKDNLNSSKAEGDNHIIRNKAAKDLDTYVKLHTTSTLGIIENEIGNIRSNSRDFSFKKTDTKPGSEYFQEVLLCQEWIDAFLKEDDAAVRYDKFIRSFGDVDLDNKYKVINELIKVNTNKIKELEKQLGGIEKELDFDFDYEILEKVNSEIDNLKKYGEKILKISSDTTDKELLNLSNQISDRTPDIQTEITLLSEKIKKIDSVVTGNNENNISVEKYFNAQHELNILTKNLKNLEDIRKQFEKQKELYILKSNKEGKLKNLINEQSKLDELVKIYPEYKKIDNNIEQTIKSINENNNNQKKLENEDLTKLVKTQNELDLKIKQKSEILQNISLRISGIPGLLEKLEKTGKEKNVILSDLENFNNSIKTIDKELDTLKPDLKEWQEIKSYISKNNYQINDIPKLKPFFLPINKLSELKEELQKIKAKIHFINNNIDNTKSFNDQVTKLISMGADIVNKNELNTCPLCKHNYEEYSILSKKISDNSYLSEEMKRLVTDKSNEENLYQKILKDHTDLHEKLITEITRIIDEIRNKIEKQELEKQGIANKIEICNENIKRIDLVLTKVQQELGTQNIDELKEKLIKEQNDLTEEIKKINEKKSDNSNQIILIQNKIEKIKTDILISKQKLKNFKTEEIYIRISDYAKLNQIENNEIIHFITENKNDLKNKIEVINNEISNISKELTFIQKQLENYEINTITADIEKTKNNIESVQTILKTFKYTLNSEFGISLNDNESKESIEHYLKEKLNSYNDTLTVKNTLFTSYNKVKEFKEHVTPFLKHENLKKTGNNLTAERKFLKENIEPKLEKERLALSSFINKQIESFFHGKLINMIYKKIDPHPTYKEISFSCDFISDGKPRLNVFVTDKDGKSIPPTLYFSTAQLNILSLSIFLAKALNVKDNDGNPVDCIFIDDPIQSMDDINILSTIDLFRSITVNMNKQIILATHDEDFHNLLKKKIPSDSFKSKFIEFETFGKVKQEV